MFCILLRVCRSRRTVKCPILKATRQNPVKFPFYRGLGVCAPTSEGIIPNSSIGVFFLRVRSTHVNMGRKTGEFRRPKRYRKRFTRFTTIIIARYGTFHRRFRGRRSSDETRVYYNDITIHYCTRKTCFTYTHTYSCMTLLYNDV